MARKSVAIQNFPMFLKLVENIFNTYIKVIQSDGGGEFKVILPLKVLTINYVVLELWNKMTLLKASPSLLRLALDSQLILHFQINLDSYSSNFCFSSKSVAHSNS